MADDMSRRTVVVRSFQALLAASAAAKVGGALASARAETALEPASPPVSHSVERAGEIGLGLSAVAYGVDKALGTLINAVDINGPGSA